MRKVGFYILGQKGFEVLKSFIETYSSKNISFIMSWKDVKLKKDHFEEIRLVCERNNIYFQERNSDLKHSFSSDVTFAIGWRWLIKNTDNLIVLHDSLLPKYRGFAPLVNMLINNEKKIGVTALKASDEYDKGSIILQKSISIEYPIKIKHAIDLISPLYSDIVLDIYHKIISGEKLYFQEQNENESTYSIWRDEDDYLVDWNSSASDIKRFCDAVGYPYSGASSYVGERKIKITEVQVVDDVCVENRYYNIGKIIFMNNKRLPIVVCKDGLLMIEEAYFVNDNVSILGNINFRTRFTSKPNKTR